MSDKKHGGDSRRHYGNESGTDYLPTEHTGTRDYEYVQGRHRLRAEVIDIAASTAYDERRNNPEFAEVWGEVEAEILDGLEEKQFEAAQERGEDRRWTLARRRPERWSEKRAVAIKAEVDIRPVKEMTDEELEAIVIAAQRGQGGKNVLPGS